jgi:hypothetical protein
VPTARRQVTPQLSAGPLGVPIRKITMIKQLLLFIVFISQYILSQELAQPYSYEFELQDAQIDSSLTNEIRDSFEDDDSSLPLKSISVDLNGDGILEKIIPNEYLCGTGLCPWLIYSPKTKTIIGEIDGKVLFINSKRKNGFNVIETYCRNGGGEGTVCFYEYLQSKYMLRKKIDLHGEQIEEYFKIKFH